MSGHLGFGVDMAIQYANLTLLLSFTILANILLPKVSSNTGCVDNIIEGEMSDSLGLLQ